MGRSPSTSKNTDVKKGPWDPEEDKKLSDYINQHGPGNWIALPKLAGLNRCGKSCRLRWINYLRPEIKRGSFTPEEEHTILHYHKILGNKWSLIARKLPGRTDNEIKNFWNTHIKKKLIRAGCDPTTHQPRSDLMSCLRSLVALANLKNIINLTQNPNFQDYKLSPYLQHNNYMDHHHQIMPATTQMVENPNLDSLQQQLLENQNNATNIFQPLHQPMMINSPHVPFAYNGCSQLIQPAATLSSSFDNGSTASFVDQSLEFDQHDSFWNIMATSNFPSTSETTSVISNAGEVTTSTSSCYNHGSEEEEAAAAYSQWEELLVDPVMQ